VNLTSTPVEESIESQVSWRIDRQLTWIGRNHRSIKVGNSNANLALPQFAANRAALPSEDSAS